MIYFFHWSFHCVKFFLEVDEASNGASKSGDEIVVNDRFSEPGYIA